MAFLASINGCPECCFHPTVHNRPPVLADDATVIKGGYRALDWTTPPEVLKRIFAQDPLIMRNAVLCREQAKEYAKGTTVAHRHELKDRTGMGYSPAVTMGIFKISGKRQVCVMCERVRVGLY